MIDKMKTEPNNVSRMAKEYVDKNDWYLIPLRDGDKMPTHSNWSEPQNCLNRNTMDFPKNLHGVGLAHVYSRTVSIDLDDLEKAVSFFAEMDIDIHQFINAPDALKLISGRENRSKLIYRLPPDVAPLQSVKRDSDGFELRCATRKGTTLQDVLPPSIHPKTGKPYSWQGDPNKVPILPAELFDMWTALLERRKTRTWDVPNIDLIEGMVEGALDVMSPDREYNEWLAIGMALDSVGLGDKWDEWSQGGKSWMPGDCDARLAGFGEDGGVGFGSFWHYAKADGWEYKDSWEGGILHAEALADYDDAVTLVASLIRICQPSVGMKEISMKRLAKAYGVARRSLEDDVKALIIAAGGADFVKNLSHEELATDFRKSLGEVVNTESAMWVYRTDRWVELDQHKLVAMVGAKYRDQMLCRTYGNYKGVVNIVIQSDPSVEFFKSKPYPGVGFKNGFYCMKDDGVVITPHKKEHRTRHVFDIVPEEGEHPLLDQLMECVDEDSKVLLQQFIGVLVFGESTRFQKCLLLYGESGTGKSILVNLLHRIFHKTSAVSPARFDEDYWKAALAGSVMNAVTELPAAKAIDSADFKAIVAGDTISARQIHEKAFDFNPVAGHIFSTNRLPRVEEVEAAFWRRWVLVEYKGQPSQNNPDLAKDIYEQELPQFFHWALMGAKMAFENKDYVTGEAHERVMSLWSDRHDIVKQCIYAEDSPFIIQENAQIKISRFIELVRSWARSEGIRSIGQREISKLAKQIFSVKMVGGRTILVGVGEIVDNNL